MAKQRLDQLLVSRGLAPSRERARAVILAGRVFAKGRRYSKPGQFLPEDAELSVTQPPPFVSRGGEKLQAALRRWPVPVAGAVCLDVGASTGGFTDCLLQHGAKQVYAVDVGYGQLAATLRADARVSVMERTHVRQLVPFQPSPQVVTLDLAFISLRAVLPSVAAVVRPAAHMVALVKPQFEVGREKVGKGGVVRDPRDRAAAVAGVAVWAIQHSWRVGGVFASPLLGPAGNREIFLWLRTPPSTGESSA